MENFKEYNNQKDGKIIQLNPDLSCSSSLSNKKFKKPKVISIDEYEKIRSKRITSEIIKNENSF